MKKFAKHFLKVLLAAMVASMTVTGAFALEVEHVETAEEVSAATASAAYYAENETVVLGSTESTTLTFENDVTEVNSEPPKPRMLSTASLLPSRAAAMQALLLQPTELKKKP